MKALKLSLVERPRFCNPMNAMAGLYLNVMASRRVSSNEELLEFVRNDVAACGYDPDGRADVGLPCCHGVVTRTYAMWFYDKVRP